jgi:hypothetical protein
VNAQATFNHLSRVLTGERTLPDRLVALYLDRLGRDPDAAPLLQPLLTRFAAQAAAPDFDAERFRTDISSDPELGPLVRRIVLLWITGALPEVDWVTAAKPEQRLHYLDDPIAFFGALMWPLMAAHVPGLSGGYFGYWRYPPEN